MKTRTLILSLLSTLAAAAPLAVQADVGDQQLAAIFARTDAIDARAPVQRSTRTAELRESDPWLDQIKPDARIAAPSIKPMPAGKPMAAALNDIYHGS